MMRLTAIILVMALMQVSAKGFGQNITLHVKNVPLEQVFKEIRRQTGYDFLFNNDGMRTAKPVTIDVINAAMDDVLKKCFADQPLSYKIENKAVMIREKTPVMPHNSQQIVTPANLSGMVVDTLGHGLPGITLKTKAHGVVTDGAGHFLLSNLSDDEIVQVSCIGFERLDFRIRQSSGQYIVTALNGRQSAQLSSHDAFVTITLRQAVNALNEAVVIGYGTQQKQDVTGSVASIGSNNLMKNSIGTGSFDHALGGLAKGVLVSQGSGEPGSSVNINIRGYTSPFSGGNNQPLFVIDGVSFNMDAQYSTGGYTDYMPQSNPLLSLDPNNIESIDILKDAAATAIYGSRGANGVVIVTTKTGKRGERTSIDFSETTSVGKPAAQLQAMNTTQYKAYTDLIFRNSADAANKGQISSSSLLPYTDGTMANLTRDPVTFKYTYKGLNPAFFGNENTNWSHLVYRNNAFTHQANLNIKGSAGKTTYSVGGSYLDQTGIMINSSLKQYNFYSNLNLQVNKFITAGTSVRLGHNVNKGGRFSQGGEASAAALSARPDLPVRDPQGNYLQQANLDYGFLSYNANPVAQLQYKNTDKGYTLLGNAFVEAEVLHNLKLKADISTGLFMTKSDHFNPASITVGVIPGYPVFQSTLQTADVMNSNSVVNLTANYCKVLDRHILQFVGGYAWDRTRVRRGFTTYQGFPDDEILINANNAARVLDYGDGVIESGLNSVFGRAVYNYDDRYLATVNFRSDASSKFGPDNKRGYFPSVSVGWNISNEGFFNKASFMERLKLRASLGTTGSSNIADFSYFQFFQKGSRDDGNYNKVPAVLFSSTLPNPNISWETTKEYNLGLDFELRGRRVYGSVDVYHRDTRNALAPTPFPLELGPANYTANLVNLSNAGVEVELNADIFRRPKGFNWRTSVNWSFNRNKIESLNGAVIDSYLQDNFIVGQPVGTIKGYKVAGIFQSQAEVDALNTAAAGKNGAGTVYDQQGTSAGDYKMVDVNGDGRITADDRVVIGSSQPDFFGGWTNTFSYKGFELSAFCQFVKGGKAYWRNSRINAYNYPGTNTLAIYDNNTWTSSNTSAQYARVVYTDPGNNRRISDKNIYDASFFKLKTLYLKYNFSPEICRQLKLSNLAVFASLSNVFTITKWPGTDPETVLSSSIALRTTNSDPYPLSRNISLGVTVQF